MNIADLPPWHGMQIAPIYVSKALLAATHDAYKVEGYWCVILPKIM